MLNIISLFFTLSSPAHAANLSDYSPYSFETLFTNPECREYLYPEPVKANNGTVLTQKPKNVYCKPSDLKLAAKSKSSPQYRLIEWISAPKVKEIFMAYLSFSNTDIRDALCSALKKGVKVTFVLDQNPDEGGDNALATGLKACGSKDDLFTVLYRGNRGGIGYAHNKIMLINPDSSTEVKLVFSSGNMSPGTVIYHENWNFITTSPKTYFLQSHLCLREGLINHGDTRKEFVSFMESCRGKIESPEEKDIQAYFVPGDGAKAFERVTELANASTKVEAAAHRFSGIFPRLFADLLKKKKEVHLVTDDDMYWAAKTHVDTGRNMVQEATTVMKLKSKGLQLKYMETDQKDYVLQHNKFMIFDLPGNKDAVFAGAGNFTSSAFDKNYENFYVITIPEVVKSFKTQYKKFWEEMATPEELLPTEQIFP